VLHKFLFISGQSTAKPLLGNIWTNTNFCLFQDNPQPSRCLGIFGLSIYTTEQQLHHIMSKYGPVERVQVVIDAKVSLMQLDAPALPEVANMLELSCDMA
jgi:hypothetical protein